MSGERGWLWAPVLVLLALLPLGCATRPPVGDELTGRERQAVQEVFLATMAQRQQEIRCLDAEAEIQWRTLLRSGMLPGYLQARAPGWLKFVGLDPLGRPALALVTDGESFRFILVGQARAYQGPTTAEAFHRHLPHGVAADKLPDSLFAWLSGGLPLEPEIVAVYREHQGRGYWLEVADPPGARLLFDPAGEGEPGAVPPLEAVAETVVPAPGLLRRVQLFEPGQRRPTEIIYDDYRAVPGHPRQAGWLLPHRIELDSRRHQGLSLTMLLSDLQGACDLTAADFQLPIPPGFTLETVE